MIEFSVWHVLINSGEIECCIRLLSSRRAIDPISEEDARRIQWAIRATIGTLGFLGETQGIDRLKRITFNLDRQFCQHPELQPQSNQTVKALLEEAHIVIHGDIEAHTFAYIPASRAEYFEQTNLFGLLVSEEFPEAAIEIKECGNCIAADLPTAAVFHLMRIAEMGMRALARRTGVEITKQKREKKCPECGFLIAEAGEIRTTPLEYAMWDEVLQALNKKLAELESNPKGPIRTEDLKRYHGLKDDLQKFKNVDRNELVHTRRSYTFDDMKPVYNSVRAFMETMATILKEARDVGADNQQPP